MTTAPTTSAQPTIDQTLDRMRKAYEELKTENRELMERVIAIEARMSEQAATDRIHQSILGRPMAELFRCPRRIDRLDGDTKVLMADLEKREAQA